MTLEISGQNNKNIQKPKICWKQWVVLPSDTQKMYSFFEPLVWWLLLAQWLDHPMPQKGRCPNRGKKSPVHLWIHRHVSHWCEVEELVCRWSSAKFTLTPASPPTWCSWGLRNQTWLSTRYRFGKDPEMYRLLTCSHFLNPCHSISSTVWHILCSKYSVFVLESQWWARWWATTQWTNCSAHPIQSH